MRKIDQPLLVLGTAITLGGLIAVAPSWIASSAFWTAIFTGALTFSTHALWRETKTSADAAKATAEAMSKAERAYVKLSHRPPGIMWTFGTSGGHFAVNLRVKNFGRTPAEVTDLVLTWCTLNEDKELPPIPDYNLPNRAVPPTQAFLVANDEYIHQQTFEIPAESRSSIDVGTLRLFVFGYVDYIDKFGLRQRAGYARRYDPEVDTSSPHDDERNNLPFVTQPGYNYDRFRERGEGLDWR